MRTICCIVVVVVVSEGIVRDGDEVGVEWHARIGVERTSVSWRLT
jgi:hypothetical protein